MIISFPHVFPPHLWVFGISYILGNFIKAKIIGLLVIMSLVLMVLLVILMMSLVLLVLLLMMPILPLVLLVMTLVCSGGGLEAE